VSPPLSRLVFAGEAIVDLLMWVPALPERGGDMLAESAAIEVGGGFNIMAAAVRQGLPVVYAGGHGTGPWGDKVRAALAADIPAAVLDPVLARCDWWSCNQREAALLTGSDDPAEAARRLVRRTGQADVIVRAGPDGCVVAMRVSGPALEHGLALSHIAAPAVTAVDTTGAGDAHSGVFLAGLAAGLTVGEAARRANAAAALAVTRAGAATSPSRAELDRFLGF
jgi:sugar/nucleoside kinase (ribokinase family)